MHKSTAFTVHINYYQFSDVKLRLNFRHNWKAKINEYNNLTYINTPVISFVGVHLHILVPLVSTTEELHERKSRGSCLENREYDRRDPSRWPRATPYPQKLALTSPTSGGRSVGIVRSQTQATEFSFPPPHKINLLTHWTILQMVYMTV
jgi:hypothetical protein